MFAAALLVFGVLALYPTLLFYFVKKPSPRTTLKPAVASPAHLAVEHEKVTLTGVEWMKMKGQVEQVEHPNLWRIHGIYYDLSNFQHPGGPDWIHYTKGTDCTEHFETHHLEIEKVRKIMEKFKVNVKDSKPTEPHFTFEKGGLYDSLRESVAKKIGKNHGPTPYMKQLTVFFTAIWFISFLITCSTKSVFFAVISGILLNPIWGIGHNFFHQKDTFLRFLFNLNITTSYEWRVSHALSHHTYTNSLLDVEITAFEPFILLFTSRKRTPFYQNWIIFYAVPIAFPITFIFGFFKNLFFYFFPIQKIEFPAEMWIPVAEWALMMLLTKTVVTATILFFVMHGTESLILVGTSFSVHRATHSWTDGDAPLKDRDFARHILATTTDHSLNDISLNLLLFAGLNDHVIHHMFPTVDHSRFDEIREDMKKICEKFGVKWRVENYFELQRGIFDKMRQVGSLFLEE